MLPSALNTHLITPPGLGPEEMRTLPQLVRDVTFVKFGRTVMYRHFYEGLKSVWPQLFVPAENDGDCLRSFGAIKLAVGIFFDIAEMEGFYVSERNFGRI